MPGWNVNVRRLPTASSPGQKRRAMASLISTTGGAGPASAAAKSRPRVSRMPRVSSVPGVSTRTATSGCSAMLPAGRPSIVMGCVDPPSVSGSVFIAPAASTPGSARTRSRMRS